MTDTIIDPDLDLENPGEEEAEEDTFVQSDASLAFTTKKFVLQNQLDRAASVLPTRDTLPVLKNFQIELDGTNNLLRVVATDTTLSLLAETDLVEITMEGTAVFPGKKILDIVKESADESIVITVEEGNCEIRVGKAKWHLLLQDGSEYPPLPDMDEAEFVTVDRSKFLAALNAVRYAAAKDTVRPTLMMINVSDGKMRAADGTRFQQIVVPTGVPDIDIPIGAVDDLVKHLRSSDEASLEIAETDSTLIFKIGPNIFFSQKLDSTFPDVDAQLLRPALANEDKLHVDRQELIAAIKRVRVTADPETSAITLNLTEDKMVVASRDKYGNNAEEEINVYWRSSERTVAFNWQHLLDMLLMSDAKSCEFLLGNDTKTRKTPLLLIDEEAGSHAVLNQMRQEYL